MSSRPLPDLWEGLPNLRKGFLTTSSPLEGPPDHSWTYGRASDLPGGSPDYSQPFGRASRPLPALRKGLPTIPDPLGGPLDPSKRPPDHTQPSKMHSQPLLDLREDLPTIPGPSGGPHDYFWTSGRASPALPDLRESSRPFPALQEDFQRIQDLW